MEAAITVDTIVGAVARIAVPREGLIAATLLELTVDTAWVHVAVGWTLAVPRALGQQARDKGPAGRRTRALAALLQMQRAHHIRGQRGWLKCALGAGHRRGARGCTRCGRVHDKQQQQHTGRE